MFGIDRLLGRNRTESTAVGFQQSEVGRDSASRLEIAQKQAARVRKEALAKGNREDIEQYFSNEIARAQVAFDGAAEDSDEKKQFLLVKQDIQKALEAYRESEENPSTLARIRRSIGDQIKESGQFVLEKYQAAAGGIKGAWEGIKAKWNNLHIKDTARRAVDSVATSTGTVVEGLQMVGNAAYDRGAEAVSNVREKLRREDDENDPISRVVDRKKKKIVTLLKSQGFDAGGGESGEESDDQVFDRAVSVAADNTSDESGFDTALAKQLKELLDQLDAVNDEQSPPFDNGLDQSELDRLTEKQNKIRQIEQEIRALEVPSVPGSGKLDRLKSAVAELARKGKLDKVAELLSHDSDFRDTVASAGLSMALNEVVPEIASDIFPLVAGPLIRLGLESRKFNRAENKVNYLQKKFLQRVDVDGLPNRDAGSDTDQPEDSEQRISVLRRGARILGTFAQWGINTAMIFENTAYKVAMQPNLKRGRVSNQMAEIIHQYGNEQNSGVEGIVDSWLQAKLNLENPNIVQDLGDILKMQQDLMDIVIMGGDPKELAGMRIHRGNQIFSVDNPQLFQDLYSQLKSKIKELLDDSHFHGVVEQMDPKLIIRLDEVFRDVDAEEKRASKLVRRLIKTDMITVFAKIGFVGAAEKVMKFLKGGEHTAPAAPLREEHYLDNQPGIDRSQVVVREGMPHTAVENTIPENMPADARALYEQSIRTAQENGNLSQNIPTESIAMRSSDGKWLDASFSALQSEYGTRDIPQAMSELMKQYIPDSLVNPGSASGAPMNESTALRDFLGIYMKRTGLTPTPDQVRAAAEDLARGNNPLADFVRQGYPADQAAFEAATREITN